VSGNRRRVQARSVATALTQAGRPSSFHDGGRWKRQGLLTIARSTDPWPVCRASKRRSHQNLSRTRSLNCLRRLPRERRSVCGTSNAVQVQEALQKLLPKADIKRILIQGASVASQTDSEQLVLFATTT
jgi:hypothetical protein